MRGRAEWQPNHHILNAFFYAFLSDGYEIIIRQFFAEEATRGDRRHMPITSDYVSCSATGLHFDGADFPHGSRQPYPF